ncbi:MAG: 3-phosphoglycerate dehydrogenase, partial [Candidatus Bathyarchaeota archaeon]
MKILICEPIEEEVIELLRQSFEVELEGELKNTDSDIIIVRSKTKVTKEIIESARNLKIIGRPGVGIDNIDVKIAEKKGVKVINTPEALTESVAELAVGLMFSLARKIPQVHINIRSGKWLKRELKGIELSKKTLGILGHGNIGRRVIEICDDIGMKIIYWSRNRKFDL